ncbi:hypothetical protein SK128_026934 [Halocaridina rubra]|uniref:Uncharacterized protein n=1 Tax=Halocaridina rubra TaxID=373956 RepID=A0AAN8WH75_HALRR
MCKGAFIFFAIDNSDFNEGTPDGKRTLHATDTALCPWREPYSDKQSIRKLRIHDQKARDHSLKSLTDQDFTHCHAPNTQASKGTIFAGFQPGANMEGIKPYSAQDSVWLLSRAVMHTTEPARSWKQLEAQKLPPTGGTLHEAIAEGYYQVMVWYQTDIPHPQLPPTTRHGWKGKEDRLVPVPTTDPPAPATASSNVGGRRLVAGPTIPVGPSVSTSPRCIGVKPMRGYTVSSVRQSRELMRMEKGEPSI